MVNGGRIMNDSKLIGDKLSAKKDNGQWSTKEGNVVINNR